MSEIPLSAIALKTSRLARLNGDIETQQMMALEAGGYSDGTGELDNETYQLARKAGRRTKGFDKTGQVNDQMVWTESIEALEQQVEANRVTLSTSQETPPARIPGQIVTPPTERGLARIAMIQASGRLASRKKLIYSYALRVHYELKYSGIAEDVFTRIRSRVDASIGEMVPDAVQKLASVYENLRSSNAEDWSNAVHSCRRILQALADVLFPPTAEERTIEREGKTIKIKYGRDQYINRLIRYVELNSDSERFSDIVGSHLRYLGDRLDAVFRATQKGSHHEVTQEEADRFVVYTYLLVGDLLALNAKIVAE